MYVGSIFNNKLVVMKHIFQTLFQSYAKVSFRPVNRALLPPPLNIVLFMMFLGVERGFSVPLPIYWRVD
jgi:hypothetical protein